MSVLDAAKKWLGKAKDKVRRPPSGPYRPQV